MKIPGHLKMCEIYATFVCIFYTNAYLYFSVKPYNFSYLAIQYIARQPAIGVILSWAPVIFAPLPAVAPARQYDAGVVL